MSIDLVRESYPALIIGASEKLGKTSITDRLTGDINVNDDTIRDNARLFYLGEKFRVITTGETRPDHQREGRERRDSKRITDEQLLQFRRQGLILPESEYDAGGIHNALGIGDARKTDVYVVYNSANDYGVERMANALSAIGRESIKVMLVSTPEIVGARLNSSNLPRDLKSLRLGTFRSNLNDLVANAGRYDFTMFVHEPPIAPAYERAQEDVLRREFDKLAVRVMGLIGFWQPRRSPSEMHRAYVMDKLQTLTGLEEDELATRVANANEYRYEHGNGRPANDSPDEYRPVLLPFPDSLKSTKRRPLEIERLARNVQVLEYVFTNGRHTVVLQGPMFPGNGPSTEAEALILELIAKRIGEPAQVGYEPGVISRLSDGSQFGLFSAERAQLRDGVMYSLGDPLPTNPDHRALGIVFAYYVGPEKPRFIGYPTDKVRSIGEKFVPLRPAAPNTTSYEFVAAK